MDINNVLTITFSRGDPTCHASQAYRLFSWENKQMVSRERLHIIRKTLTIMGGFKGLRRRVADTILVLIFQLDARLHVPDPEIFDGFMNAAHRGNLKQLEIVSRSLHQFSWAPFFRGIKERDQTKTGTRGQLVADKWYRECIRRDPANVECLLAQSRVASQKQRGKLWRRAIKIFPGIEDRVIEHDLDGSHLFELSLYLNLRKDMAV